MKRPLLFVFISVCGLLQIGPQLAIAQTLQPADVAGVWKLTEGLEPYSSKAYTGKITFKHLGGGIFKVIWEAQKATRIGVGLLSGNQLVVGFDGTQDPGVAHYAPSDDPTSWLGAWASLGEQDEYVSSNAALHKEAVLGFSPFATSASYTITDSPFTTDEPYFGQLSLQKTGLNVGTVSWSSGGAGVALVQDKSLSIGWSASGSTNGLRVAVYTFTGNAASGLFARPNDDTPGNEVLSR